MTWPLPLPVQVIILVAWLVFLFLGLTKPDHPFAKWTVIVLGGIGLLRLLFNF